LGPILIAGLCQLLLHSKPVESEEDREEEKKKFSKGKIERIEMKKKVED
jgi:hypothetical protein